MRRRTFLAVGTGLTAGVGLTDLTHGVSNRGETRDEWGKRRERETTTPQQTTVEDKPDGVYVQPFLETMSMQGMVQQGEYAVAVMYTILHTFWTMTGTDLTQQPLSEEASAHIMALVWDPETNTVLPEVGLSVEITQEESLVSEEVIYPMLSQRMGFHYGANFTLPGDGTYTVNVNIGGMQIRRTGAFEGRFSEGTTAKIDLTFTEATRSEIRVREIDQAGTPGALKPMEMDMAPLGTAPSPDDLPGSVVGTAESDDAQFVVTRVPAEESDRFTDGQPYLLASARTPYNGFLLPMMGVDATLSRGGETVFDGRLERTLDPEVGYHYGTGVESIESGDSLTLSVPTPPQVARHQGYETAFLEMPEMQLEV